MTNTDRLVVRKTNMDRLTGGQTEIWIRRQTAL